MRIAIQQPALPAYRVPFFKRLGESCVNDDIVLHYGSEEPALTNAEPDGFKAIFNPFQTAKVAMVGKVFWHHTQWQIVDGRSYDAVVLSANMRFVSYWLALIRARINRVPVAVWGHGFSKSGRSFVRDWIRSLPLRLASAAVFYDHVTAERWVAAGIDQNRVFVAPNGLDSTAIESVRQTLGDQLGAKSALRRRIGLAADTPVLLFVGRLMPENRLDIAFQALASILLTHPDTRMAIIGAGEQEQRSLSSLASELNIEDAIIWVGEQYTERSLAEWFTAADLFVYPANVGLSLIHAFNYGLPAIICGPVSSHNPEVAALTHRVNGVVTEELSADSLAAAISSLLSSQQMLTSMGAAALKTVTYSHNVNQMVDAFQMLFQHLNALNRR